LRYYFAFLSCNVPSSPNQEVIYYFPLKCLLFHIASCKLSTTLISIHFPPTSFLALRSPLSRNSFQLSWRHTVPRLSCFNDTPTGTHPQLSRNSIILVVFLYFLQIPVINQHEYGILSIPEELLLNYFLGVFIMLTVSNLLLHPLFSNFKLISDSVGLDNPIKGTGIFEWETPDRVAATFLPGLFVVTTLSNMQNNPRETVKSLKIMIDKKIAALSLKTVCVSAFPDEVMEYANQNNVPVFLFSEEPYFDDIIYTIHSLLAQADSNLTNVNKIRKLLKTDSSEIQSYITEELNPAYKETCLCCCITPKEESPQQMLNDAFAIYSTIKNELPVIHSVIRGNHCIIIICTNHNGEALHDEIDKICEKVGFTEKLYRFGYSDILPVSELKCGIEQAMHSLYIALIKHMNVVNYSPTDIFQIIIPFGGTKQFKTFYNMIASTIKDYDSSHKTSLHETLISYIECDGDIKLTAQKLFQHSNTIRYRLERIKTLLNLDEKEDIYMQLFIYEKLHQLHMLYNGEPLI